MADEKIHPALPALTHLRVEPGANMTWSDLQATHWDEPKPAKQKQAAPIAEQRVAAAVTAHHDSLFINEHALDALRYFTSRPLEASKDKGLFRSAEEVLKDMARARNPRMYEKFEWGDGGFQLMPVWPTVVSDSERDRISAGDLVVYGGERAEKPAAPSRMGVDLGKEPDPAFAAHCFCAECRAKRDWLGG